MRLSHKGQRFCPLQCRAFALAVEGRFSPGIEQVKTLFCLAALSGFAGMHVKAKGAAVDLRYADLHEIHQGVFQAKLEGALAVFEPRLHGSRRGREWVQSRCHDYLLVKGASTRHDEMDGSCVTSPWIIRAAADLLGDAGHQGGLAPKTTALGFPRQAAKDPLRSGTEGLIGCEIGPGGSALLAIEPVVTCHRHPRCSLFFDALREVLEHLGNLSEIGEERVAARQRDEVDALA